MKKIILLTWLACSMQMTQIFAHFAPRGFTGGTVTKGIRVPGFMFLGTQEGGVYRSTNNAISAWGTRSVGLLSGKINDFAYDGTSVIAATDRGLYIFDGVDGNDRFWRKIDAGLAKYFFPASSNQHFDVKINAVSVVNTNIGRLIFVGTDSGVYFTEDYGADFKEVDNVLLKSNTITGFLQTTGANNALLVSVKDKGLVINRTITAAYKDEDFTEFNDDNTRGESVKLLGVADDIISISKGDMVLGSTVATPSFTSVSAGLASGIDIYSLAYTSSRVFLATSGGLYSREKNELAWTLSSNSNLNSQSVNVVVATSDTLVVGISNLGVLKSTDNGSTWAATNTGLANIKTFALDAWGIRDAVSNVVVSATELGVAISRNLGLSPSLVNKGLTDSLNVTDVKIYPSYIYASTRNSGVFRIANNASSTTWEAVNQGLPSGKAIIKLSK